MAKTLNTGDALASALTHLFGVDDDNVIKEFKAGLTCTPHANVLKPNTGSSSAPVGKSFRTGGAAGAGPTVYGVDFPNYVVSNAAAFSVFVAVNQYNNANSPGTGYAAELFGSDSAGIKIGPGMQMDPTNGKFFKHNNNGAVVTSGTLNSAGAINGAGIKSFGMTVTAGGVVKMFINGVVDSAFSGGIANTGNQFGSAWTNADFSLIGGQPANSWVSFDWVYVADFIGTVVSDAEMLRLHNSLTGSDAFALISLPAPPTITTQPTDQTVTVGSAATFTVVATGTGLTYQWQRNIVDISGANAASYTTPATSLSGGAANAGDTYRCVVTNGAGASVTSNSATLNVNAAPATAITFTGPSSGQVGVASAAFTIGANGEVSGSHVVTLSDGGAGGTFSPATVTLTAGAPSATATYTAASAGVKTLGASDAGGYTAPSSLSYTASTVAGTFTSDPLKDNTGALIASQALVHVTLYDNTTGALVVRKTGLSTNASGVFSFSDAAVAPGTTYRCDWRTVAGHYRMPAKVAS